MPCTTPAHHLVLPNHRAGDAAVVRAAIITVKDGATEDALGALADAVGHVDLLGNEFDRVIGMQDEYCAVCIPEDAPLGVGVV